MFWEWYRLRTNLKQKQPVESGLKCSCYYKHWASQYVAEWLT